MTDKLDRDIEQLFVREVLPLGRRARSRGAALLDTGWKQDVPTYFRRRSKAIMTRADFESGGFPSPDTAEAELRRLWSTQPGVPLAALAPPFARLARRLHEVAAEAEEVSSFVYVMY